MADEKPMLIKAFIIVAIIFLADVGFVFYQYGNLSQGFTGFSISDTASKAYFNMSNGTKIILGIQWIVIMIVLAFVFVRDKSLYTIKDDLGTIKREKSDTDIDALYRILKIKKQLKISGISKAFKIDKEIALDWGKTLEDANLAVIEYPGIGEPVIRITSN